MANFIVGASSSLVAAYLRDHKLGVRLSSLHVDGVFAREFIHEGDTLFAEKPLCFLQTIPNAQDIIICGECQTVLGALDIQVGVLSKTLSREEINAREDSCQCQAKCGVLYCSAGCNLKHWNRGHKLLCTGFITDEEAGSSPLFNFKMHACATNEIFLLVADVFAGICCEVEANRKVGTMDETSIVAAALHPYDSFVRNPWWEVAIPSARDQKSDPEESPEKFAQTLRHLVAESWEMLRQVLELDNRGLTEVLSVDYFARTIGMFEQNNIGVRCDHPLATAISSLDPHNSLVTPLLSAAETISQYLEEQEGCDDDWEDADDDDVDSKEEDDMDDCDHSADCGHGHEHEAMDDAETSDDSLNKLNSILREYGIDSIFPPLDGTALYSMLCKINHSCEPNVRVKYAFTREYGLVAHLIALNDIQPETELLQSYIDQNMDTVARQTALADYGFSCTCEKCISL